MSPPPFTRFMEEHREPVYRFLLAAVGPHDADDCFQETFLAALRAYPRLAQESNLRAWVFTIATRKVIDHERARARRPAPVEHLPEQTADQPPDGDPEIWRAVRSLPAKQRVAILQRYVLDLPYADIARTLGCSVEAARASAHAGRRKLREALHPDGSPRTTGGRR
ncbi:MAG TPA: RNA polymerase sigma factor [Actinomycetota bacterium]|nr:RNA polymerase sigma factor [Actinomycetota bacterium]